MGVQIDIDVSTGKVRSAREDVSALNRLLKETKSIGGGGASGEGTGLKEAAVKGGIPTTSQLAQATSGFKRMLDYSTGYAGSLKAARVELERLIQLQMKASQRVITLGDGTRYTVPDTSSGGELSGQVAAKRQQIADLERRRRDLGLRDDGGEGPSGGPSIMGAAGLSKYFKGAGWVYAAFKAAQSVNNDWNTFLGHADLDTSLAVRGMGGAVDRRDLSPYGFAFADEKSSLFKLQAVTGSTYGLRGLERFSRGMGFGTDVNPALEARGGLYLATGANGQKQDRYLDILAHAVDTSKDRRTEEILRLINANLMSVLRGNGGKALTDGQTANILGTTMGMYNRAGTMGNDTQLFDLLHGGLRLGGGDSYADIVKWRAMGGFNGPMTPEKILGIQHKMDMGLLDPTMRRNVMGQLAQGTRAQQTLNAERFLFGKSFMQTPGASNIAEMLLDLYHPTSGLLTNETDPARISKIYTQYLSGRKVSPQIKAVLDAKIGLYSGTTASAALRRQALKQSVEYGAGEEYEKNLGQVAESVTQLKDEAVSSKLFRDVVSLPKTLGNTAIGKRFGFAVDAARGAQYNQVFRDAAEKSHIPMAVLKGVAWAESGFRKSSVSSRGARGLMQLMPDTGRALGITDLADPQQNVYGGAAYLAQLYNKYGDLDKTLAAYNWGPGNVDKYGMDRLPKETREYISRSKYGIQRFAEFDSGASAGGSSLGNLSPKVDDILRALNAIEANTSRERTLPR